MILAFTFSSVWQWQLCGQELEMFLRPVSALEMNRK